LQIGNHNFGFIGLVWGQDCTADDGTDGVELWGVCYSIENTDSL